MGVTRESSHIFLRLYPITAGSILLTDNPVALKRGDYEPAIIVKRTECRKFIYYFGQSIEADTSRVGKKKIYFSMLGIYQELKL